jgi:hypothetical protein
VKDVVDGQDLTFSQKEKLLNRNAVQFFRLKDLPQPAALKKARQSWATIGQQKIATA